MTLQELADELSRMCRDARKHGKQEAAILLFGIKYADQLHDLHLDSGEAITRIIKKIVELSDIRDSFHTDVRKGMKLAEFVVPRS